MGSYVPSTAREREEMLRAIGLERMDDLFRDVPEQVRRAAALRLLEGLSEMALRARMEAAGLCVEYASDFADNADGCMRINIACPRSVLRDALGRLVHALA